MKVFMFSLFIITNIGSNQGKGSDKIKKLFEWCPGEIEFLIGNKQSLQDLEAKGKFIRKNNVPCGLALHPHKKKMFITVPRWKKGVLSTLNWVPIGTGNLNEPLRPYPCWRANDIYGDTEYPYKIISVVRVFVDSCNRLWVIDSGFENKVVNRTQLEPPKLLIFDVINDKLIRKYTFHSPEVGSKSSLGKIVVDVTPKTCDEAFAYITDVTYPGIIVYSYRKNKAFRFEHNFLMMEPLKSTFYVEGKKIYSNVHIDGISLSGRNADGDRKVYLSPQSTNNQFFTTTKYLRDESSWSTSDGVFLLGEWCESCRVGGAQAVDEDTGVMFYGELSNNSIGCWSGDHERFGPSTQESIAESPELEFVSDMVITGDRESRELAAMSCQLRTFLYTDRGVTARVFVGIVDKLVEGTVCRHRPKPSKPCCRKCCGP